VLTGRARSSLVVFVVQPRETNVVDQRGLEFLLWQRWKVPVLRLTLMEIASRAVLDEETGAISVDGQEIGVFYYRSCYAPTDLPTEEHWEARLKIERSRAIKCPSLLQHMLTAKKIQQQLTLPGEVERFIGAEDAAFLRTCFAGQWSLDDDSEATRAIIADACAKPHLYVLKPQREGGGNNLYGDEIREALLKMSVAERSAFILMQRIFPPVQRSVMLRRGGITVGDAISELGVFSAVLSRGPELLLDSCGGFLLRTKVRRQPLPFPRASAQNMPLPQLHGVDEGGVAAGFAVLDTPMAC
jgi:glutathione synthetase